MSERDWQGLDAEAGALLEALGCDTGRGEHEETAAALRRAFEAGARAAVERAAVRAESCGHAYEAGARAAYERAASALRFDWLPAVIRGLPLPSPEREEPGR